MNGFIAFILFFTFFPSHPIHLAICDIAYNNKTKSLEISHHIFVDDLEAATKKAYGLDLKIATAKERKECNAYLEKYIAQHFSVYNEKDQKFKIYFIGKELEGDAIWIYLEIRNVKKVSTLKISNSILMDLYDDQTDIVNMKSNTKTKSLSFKKGDTIEEISF